MHGDTYWIELLQKVSDVDEFDRKFFVRECIYTCVALPFFFLIFSFNFLGLVGGMKYVCVGLINWIYYIVVLFLLIIVTTSVHFHKKIN